MDQKLGSERQSCVFQLKEKSGNIGLFIPKRICLRQYSQKIAKIEKRTENYSPRTPCEHSCRQTVPVKTSIATPH